MLTLFGFFNPLVFLKLAGESKLSRIATTRERKSYAQRISDERDVLSETATKADAGLEEADEEIRSMKSKIDSVKAAILRNDEKVAKLLSMVVTPN